MTSPGRRRRSVVWLLGSLVVLGLAVSGAWAVLSGRRDASSGAEHYRVVGAVGGDVLDVTAVRTRHLVRLSGVEAPRTTAASGTECLAPEAHDALRRLAPTGSPITLRGEPGGPGGARADGRGGGSDEGAAQAAAVYDHRGRLIAAELARDGLVVPSPTGASEGTADPTRARDAEALAEGFDHARTEGAGFYDEDLACTVPGQVRGRITTLQLALGPRQRWADGGSAPVPAQVDAALASATDLWRHLSTDGPHRGAPEWRALSANDTALLRMLLEAAIVGTQAVRFGASTLAGRG